MRSWQANDPVPNTMGSGDDPLPVELTATSAVFAPPRSPSSTCTKNMSRACREADADSVRLQSSDGETFEVSLRVARLSRTLDTMLKDLGHEPDDLIPLPKVNSRILKKVLGWAEHEIREQMSHHQHGEGVATAASPSTSTAPHPPNSPTSVLSPAPTPFQPRPQACVSQRSSRQLRPPPPHHALTEWEQEFISKNKDELYDLLLAANYLDIKSLLDVLCRTVAEMIKGKDPEEIRRRFHVTDPTHLSTDTPPSSPSPQLHPSAPPHLENTRHIHEERDSSCSQQEQLPGDRETPV